MRSTLLLASNSPRRRELLVQAGFTFEIFAPKIFERFDVDLTLRELTAFNAIRKGMAAARLRPSNVVLAADTLVAIDDHVLGKPKDREEAVTMLANELQRRVKPDGLAIVMEADHFCMHWRGVKDDESMMTNSVMRGAFLKDSNLRREFLSLLGKRV